MVCDEPEPKRRKLSKDDRPSRQPSHVDSVKDLKEILVFEQDFDVARQNIQRLKGFLVELRNEEQTAATVSKRKVLEALFLSDQTSTPQEQSDVVSGLLQTWHFASQLEHDVLCSSIPATLSLLLKHISNDISFRKSSSQICENLLREDNLKLFDRNLGSQKPKEHLIEPCIRLLTEIVEFDGGSLAKLVFRHRFTTLQRLETFLATKKHSETRSDKAKRPVSIREVSVRYLLANLRLQEGKGKEFLLSQPRLSRALLQQLSEDPQWLLEKVFEVLENDVLADSKIDRSVLRRFFSSAALLDLARLYGNAGITYSDSAHTSLRVKVHGLLLRICVSPDHGLLKVDRAKSQHDLLDPSDVLASTGNDDAASTPRKSTGLSSIRSRFVEFFHRLRPHADILQAELIIQAFRQHPEFVAEYFQHKSTFTLDPKLTMTWLGYCRFLLACIQNPISETFLLDHINRQDSGVHILNHVIPPQCTRKFLTKCFNQIHEIITFMAISILNAAFEKIDQVAEILRQSKRDQPSAQVMADLRIGFAEVCPDFRLVIGQYYGSSNERPAYRQSIARLLVNYFRLVPEVASEAKFDISGNLFNSLESTGDEEKVKGYNRLRTLESGDLIQISRYSPSVQWFQKSGGLTISLFTALLKNASSLTQSEWKSWASIGSSVAVEYRIIQSTYCMRKVAVLIQSLVGIHSDENHDLYDFVDICVTKLARAPVKYRDKLLCLMNEGNAALDVTQTDLIFVSVWDQWAHVNQKKPESASLNIASWLGRVFKLFSEYVKTKSFIMEVYQQVLLSTADEKSRSLIESGLDHKSECSLSTEFMHSLDLNSMDHAIQGVANLGQDLTVPDTETSLLPPTPPLEPEDHPELHRWASMDLQDAITDGMIGDLYMCLCSQILAVRREGLAKLELFRTRLEASQDTFPDWQQEYLLTLELSETAKDVVSDRPLPHFAAAFATQCAVILMDPLHFMYVKINTFLQQAPSWNLVRLPKQWIKNIILSEPTEAGKYSLEVNWLLDVLFDGLRTKEDTETYQTCHVFEYLQSMCNSPWTSGQTVRKAINILIRCTQVGGSTILKTKFATSSWILALGRIHDGEFEGLLKSLNERLDESCDLVAVTARAGGRYKSEAAAIDNALKHP